jgi:N-methylhydantoinase B/oxoprolinase/acetone carboxylase alpha subunit
MYDMLNVPLPESRSVQVEMHETQTAWLLEQRIIEPDPDCEGEYRLATGPQREIAVHLLLVGDPA